MSKPPPAPELPPETLPVLNQIAGRQRRFSIQVKVVSLIIVLALLLLLKFLGLDFMFMKKWSGFISQGAGFTLLVSVLEIGRAHV